VVRLRAHGVSDGVAYEVQEYLQHGTLRQFLAAGPLPVADVRRIVKELADALNGIPRATHPAPRFETRKRVGADRSTLELALSDFGIASLREATQHFTGGARTAKIRRARSVDRCSR
jgi:serine/threonine protein kinase